MKTDAQIQKDVLTELKWQPFLKASDIRVSVTNGIVTLSGEVDAYLKKIKAEEAVKKVSGVKAVVEDIHLRISPISSITDADIADAAITALKWHPAVRDERIKITVEDGKVRLEGETDWDYQRASAASAVEHLAGVKSVANFIRIKPTAIAVDHASAASDVRTKIHEAFHRSATLDARKLQIEVNGSTVVLKGIVRSFAEKKDAENAAWSAPGITNVESELTVILPEYSLED